MSNQLKMVEVQAVLTLMRSGLSRREIARRLNIHRHTVARYLRAAADQSKPTSAPLGSEEASSGSLTAAICPSTGSSAAGWREVITAKLEAGLTARRIYQDLTCDHGYTGSYYSVRRFDQTSRPHHSNLFPKFMPVSSCPAIILSVYVLPIGVVCLLLCGTTSLT